MSCNGSSCINSCCSRVNKLRLSCQSCWNIVSGTVWSYLGVPVSVTLEGLAPATDPELTSYGPLSTTLAGYWSLLFIEGAAVGSAELTGQAIPTATELAGQADPTFDELAGLRPTSFELSAEATVAAELSGYVDAARLLAGYGDSATVISGRAETVVQLRGQSGTLRLHIRGESGRIVLVGDDGKVTIKAKGPIAVVGQSGKVILVASSGKLVLQGKKPEVK